MTDKIYIKDLLVRGTIGIYDWERPIKQDILVNIELSANINKAGNSDNIEDAVNYKEICKRIIDLIEKSQFFLIEKLITHIAKTILFEFQIEKLKIKIEKPGALRFAKSVGIEIERSKKDFAN